MSTYRTTETRFLADIADHQINVLQDEGLYRHIRFQEPGTMCMHFDLLTWPGSLCYTGDMGTFVFTRLRDMFEFFRTDRQPRSDRQLFINLSYWAEKLIAVDSSGHRGGSAKEYEPEIFQRVVKEQLVSWWRDGRLDREGRRELREAVQELLDQADEGLDAVHRAANEFQFDYQGRRYEFDDFWEHDLTDYTSRFTWCCYAIAWGIQQYDTLKPTPAIERGAA